MIHSVPHLPYESVPLETRVRVRSTLPKRVLDELRKQGVDPEKQYFVTGHAMRFYLPENYQYQQVKFLEKTIPTCIYSDFRTVRLHTGVFVNLDYLVTNDDNWFLAPPDVFGAPLPAFEVDDHVIVDDRGYRVAGYHIPSTKITTTMGDSHVSTITYPCNVVDRSFVVHSNFSYVYDLISDEHHAPSRRTAIKEEMTLSKRGACWKRISHASGQETCYDSLDDRIREAFAFSEIKYVETGETICSAGAILIPVAHTDFTRPMKNLYYQFECDNINLYNQIIAKYPTVHDKTLALGFISNNINSDELVRDYINIPD